MSDRTCSIEGCDKSHVARGWCAAHYQLWKTYGVPERVRPVYDNPICAVEGCDRPRELRGWCRRHYSRWLNHGDPTAGCRMRGTPLPPCSVEGCVQPTKRILRGLCEMHYSRVHERKLDVGPPGPLKIFGDDEARFWSYVDMEGPLPPHRLLLGWCWQWTGGRNRLGYGTFSADGRAVGPHRWAWEHFIGPIPDGHHIDHLCHNRACVNFLRHLEPVPRGVNMERKLVVAPEYGWASGF